MMRVIVWDNDFEEYFDKLKEYFCWFGIEMELCELEFELIIELL